MNLRSQVAIFGTELRIAFGSIGSSFTLVGSLTSAAHVAYLNNQSNQTLVFSTDGVNNGATLAAGQTMAIDLTTNKTDFTFVLTEFQPFYVKYDSMAPASGFATISYIVGR